MRFTQEDPRAVTSPAWLDFAHTGPDTLAGRYMRLFWHPVYVADELKPGDAVPIQIMSERYTLYRGEAGSPHILAFRCAHRGTQLSTGWVEADTLRCFYHGWVYGPDGQCVEQPGEPEPFCQRVRINSFPIQEYAGLIFGYFGDGEAPALPRYPQLDQEGVLEAEGYYRACNYFNDIDNDRLHSAFVHRGRFPRPIPIDYWTEEVDWGIAMYTKYPGDLVNLNFQGMPNLTYGRTPPWDPAAGEKETIRWFVPMDDAQHMTFSSYLTPITGEAAAAYRERRAAFRAKGDVRLAAPELAEEVLAGRMKTDDLCDHPEVVLANVQDDVSQVGQGAIADRTHEMLGRSDASVVAIRRVWMRELRALAEGHPLKQWLGVEKLTPRSGITRERAAINARV